MASFIKRDISSRLIWLMGLLFCLGILSGCSWLAVNLTPMPVVDVVARGGAVARIAEKEPPKTEEDLKAYLQSNREAWEELEVWFELK